MIKRFIGASLLAITLGFSASVNAAVDGDACTFKLAANKIYQTSSTAKFTCTTLFNGEAFLNNAPSIFGFLQGNRAFQLVIFHLF